MSRDANSDFYRTLKRYTAFELLNAFEIDDFLDLKLLIGGKIKANLPSHDKKTDQLLNIASHLVSQYNLNCCDDKIRLVILIIHLFENNLLDLTEINTQGCATFFEKDTTTLKPIFCYLQYQAAMHYGDVMHALYSHEKSYVTYFTDEVSEAATAFCDNIQYNPNVETVVNTMKKKTGVVASAIQDAGSVAATNALRFFRYVTGSDDALETTYNRPVSSTGSVDT